MSIQPVITEKSMLLSKMGKYTFRVPVTMNKYQIKKAIEDIFKVKVGKVTTTIKKQLKERSVYGKTKIRKPIKKAVVVLKGKDTIDIFEEKKTK